jgi:prophage antirepressor-like protein
MEKKNELTRMYENQEVAFRENNGQSEVRIDEVAKFCGWTEIAKSGNEVIKWTRVNKYLSDLGSSTLVSTGNFIPEYIMYPLIGKAKNDRATKFMLWVGKVLVEIRQNGAYISKDITEEQENKIDKYSTNRKIKNTFKTCNIETIEQEYKECMIYHKNKDGKEKNNIQKIIINSLNGRKQDLIDNGRSSFALVIAEVMNNIVKKQKETNNKSRGQIIYNKNKIIFKLENEIADLNPPLENYMVLNVHGMSENYLYETVLNDYTGKNITVKTNTYKNWIRNFPSHQLMPKDEINVDWDKPIIVFLKFDCMAKFDKQNLLKSAIDQIITREYGENDSIIDKMIIDKNKNVDSFKDGKIYCYIRNAD